MAGKTRVLAVLVAFQLAIGTAIAQPAGAPAPQPEQELPPDLAPRPSKDEPPAPVPAPTTPTTEPTPPPPPSAPTDPKVKAEARKLIDGGDAFIKKGDYLEKKGKHEQALEMYGRALAAYEKAYDLVANAQIYFAIAGAEEKLGRWLDAAQHYKKMLAEASDMKPALKDAATAKLENVKQYLGQLAITVVPDGATVTIDGKELGVSPLAEPILVDPGEYTFGFTADGFTPMEQKVKVEAGSESERSFTLQPIPVVVEKPRPPPPPPPPPKVVSKMPLYAGAGVTAAFGVTALITGILAVKKHGTFTDPGVSADERESARTSGKHFALAADLTLVGALAAGGFTAYWYVKKYKPQVRAAEQESQPGAGVADEPVSIEMPGLWFSPLVGPDGGGMAVGGRF